MNTDKNNETLKALIGNVEWIYTHSIFGIPQVVFRRDGELHGLQIREIERGAYFGPHGKVNNYPGLNEAVFEPLDRIEALRLVMYLNPARLTEAEKAEWNSYCVAEHERQEELKARLSADEIKAKQRQLAELKRELGE